MMQWTDEQLRAIEVRGAKTLVAAAAGSGKTAVLTERVKNILCDSNNPCLASELLVVTFTRAAAGEMRDRIEKALKKELKETGSEHIKRQLKLLPTADICTIDSFCSKTVRENFHLAGVCSNFSVLDEADENELLKLHAEQLIEELYAENDESFLSLARLFLSERDDSMLSEIILSLYKFSRAYPSPFLWLEKIAEEFNPEKPAAETVWAQQVLRHTDELFSYHMSQLEKAIALANQNGVKDSYIDKLVLTQKTATGLIGCARAGDWDGFLKLVYSAEFSKTSLTGKFSERLKNFIKGAFDDCKKDVLGLREKQLPNSDEHKKDCEKLYPVVKKLVFAVKNLTERVNAQKKLLNKYSFDDICHMCIDMLVTPEGDSFKRTPLAEALSEKYKEVLIDEYQDTNAAQDMIFKAVSRSEENLYCVGDVKQSIYGFRLASPELFISLKKELSEYNGEKKPSRIALNANFRSRKEITSVVNFVFSRIMSESVGEIEYDSSEKLNFGANYYPETDSPSAELVLIDAKKLNAAAAVKYEAERVALYIKESVLRGDKVYDRDLNEMRPCRYDDFCILLRSAKSKAEIYSNALESVGIPAFSENDAPVQNAKEATVLISLLKVVNNPLLDIPLASVLMSPLFGFTPDEMSEIRLCDRNGDLYFCLLEYAKKSEKASSFIKKLELYGNIAATYPIDEFVKFVVDDTAIKDIYLSLPDGAQRVSSVNGVLGAAARFTDNKRIGLSAFTRYLDTLVENNALKRTAASSDGENAVRVMSVHKSKGLEFPIVILADLSKQFNFMDVNGSLVLSKEFGIGIKMRDDESFTSYETLSSAACRLALKRSILSEDLRVLYVAMTRARERLVMFCTTKSASIFKNTSELLVGAQHGFEKAIAPIYVLKSTSYAAWLLSCFAFHEDAGLLRELCGEEMYVAASSDFRLKIKTCTYTDNSELNGDFSPILAACDEAFLKKVREQAEYSYPYDELSGVLAKRTASSLEPSFVKREFFATEVPSFSNASLSGALRGTAVHRFLELCDFSHAYADFEAEKNKLVASKKLTALEAEAVDPEAVRAFLDAPIGQRLLNSDSVFKEYEFSVLRSAGEIYEGLSDNLKDEQIVLEGKLDCAFKEGNTGVVIDYKTDNITDEKRLADMYRRQVEIYKEAFSECEGVTVNEVYLYSFKLKKFIRI